MNLNKKSIINILLHLFFWGVIITINSLLIKNMLGSVPRFQPKIWFVYILLFYLNNLWLMPLLLFKKRFLLYCLVSVVVIGITFKVNEHISNKYFENFQHEIFEKKLFTSELSAADKQALGPMFGKINMRPKIHFLIYGILTIYSASLAVGLLLKWIKDEKHKAELDRRKISNELNFLKQQLNPHFLFNTINSVYSMSLNNSPKIPDTILKLSSILRYMLYQTDKKWVCLSEELSIIESYIGLQRLRLNKNIIIDHSFSGCTTNKFIAPLLLIPIFENAFKHGVDNINGSLIYSRIDARINTLSITVTNSIVKKNSDKNEFSGLGLANMRRRLELLYPKQHNFDVSNNGRVYNVNLEIQLN